MLLALENIIYSKIHYYKITVHKIAEDSITNDISQFQTCLLKYMYTLHCAFYTAAFTLMILWSL